MTPSRRCFGVDHTYLSFSGPSFGGRTTQSLKQPHLPHAALAGRYQPVQDAGMTIDSTQIDAAALLAGLANDSLAETMARPSLRPSITSSTSRSSVGIRRAVVSRTSSFLASASLLPPSTIHVRKTDTLIIHSGSTSCNSSKKPLRGVGSDTAHVCPRVRRSGVCLRRLLSRRRLSLSRGPPSRLSSRLG